MATLRIKRVYDAPASGDGKRILADRLWPRGMTREAAGIDYWAKAIAPSSELRQWYAHEEPKWPEFRRRYIAELDANPAGVAELRAHLGNGVATLLFQSKELQLNNAAALLEYLEARGARKK
jgi:uncharacterized protein YeaO (DUF488 family)